MFYINSVPPGSVVEFVRQWLQQTGNMKYKQIVFSTDDSTSRADTLLLRYFPLAHYHFSERCSSPDTGDTEQAGEAEDIEVHTYPRQVCALFVCISASVARIHSLLYRLILWGRVANSFARAHSSTCLIAQALCFSHQFWSLAIAGLLLLLAIFLSLDFAQESFLLVICLWCSSHAALLTQ